MSTEENKRIAKRFYEEAINLGKDAVMDEVMAEGFVEHGARPGQGRDGFKQFLKSLAAAFPDIRVTIEDLVAEDDKVAARVTVRGTHQGMLMGNIAPTGVSATWTGIDILQIKEGRIAARWSERDLLGLLRQLGVVD